MADPHGEIPVLKPGIDIASPDKAQPQIDEATRKLYLDSLPKTVQLRTDRGSGSGFFMDKDGKIGTAAHVVLGTSEQFALTSDGTKYKLEIEKLDDTNDIAILKPIGLKAGSRPFAEMATSSALKADQALFPIGNPNGLRPAYISPGNFQESMTMSGVFKSLDAHAEEAIEKALHKLPPNEINDVKAALARDVIKAKAHIRPGDSGGPVFDEEGKVIGINDFIHKIKVDGYFVPVEKIRDLYNNNDSKFQFTYTLEASPWAEKFKNTWSQKPLVAGTEALLVGGIGTAALQMSNRFPRLIGLSAASMGAYNLMDDAGSLLSSTDSRDTMKYSLAGTADLASIAGGIALLSSRYRVGGAVGIALGLAGRLAVDFIPTRHVLTDIQRKDNSFMSPMNQDIQKALGF